jgi:hypothetical protein
MMERKQFPGLSTLVAKSTNNAELCIFIKTEMIEVIVDQLL